MIHRFALRVLPSLTLPVTEDRFRKRKRWVMLVPGLVAFALYRLVKLYTPLHDALSLLLLSGCIAALTAWWAYQLGREASPARIWVDDGPRRVAWVVGWIGFAYGVQLSLLVLALLRVLAQYDFLLHPDGPAMMALIIPATSVARDALEIGHIRFLQQNGKPIVTFPDGRFFWTMVSERRGVMCRWLILAGGLCGLASWISGTFGADGQTELGQFFLVSMLGGVLALVAYLVGQNPERWMSRFSDTPWIELFRFWWWPGLAFAATYYLVALGAVLYIGRQEPVSSGTFILVSSLVGMMMALYCYVLGRRRTVEDRVRQEVPSNLLRCPFVMGILSKGKQAAGESLSQSTTPTEAVLGPTGQGN